MWLSPQKGNRKKATRKTITPMYMCRFNRKRVVLS
jgi:hypothetical protein